MNLSAVDLNLLVVFEALMAERSVTRAARRVGLSQPAASNALSRLRALFRDDLLVRVPGGMEPTAKARDLVEPVRDALDRLRGVLDGGTGFDPATARRAFTLAASDYVAFLVLPSLMEAVGRIAPGIDLRQRHLAKESVEAAIDRGEADAALGVFPQLSKRIRAVPLFRERFVLAARRGHPALDGGALTPEEFAALPHVLMTLRRDATGAIDDALAGLGLKRRVALTVADHLLVPFVIAASDMVAALPQRMAQRFAECTGLMIREVPLPLPPWDVSLIWGGATDRDSAQVWLRKLLTHATGAL